MRYQERIYIQNDNRAVRNKDILNVNMSSDFCVFQSPKFDVSGATKVQCDQIILALTGYSFNNMLTAATNTCFTVTGVDLSCYTGTTWETRIYEDSNLSYSGSLYTSTILSGGTPLSASFLSSVVIAFNALGYSFTQTGSTFSVYKPYGVKELEIDVCISFQLKEGNASCPVGYSANPANDGCEKINVTGATFNGSGSTIISGNTDVDYSSYGAYFYPQIQNNGALPVYYEIGTGLLKNQTGGTITALNINATNPFWYNSGTTTNGRLNNVGLSASSTEYVGFSKCIDIASGGTYYVALAADNYCKFTVNGVLIAQFSALTGENFKTWSVFPFNLQSGKNIIEMYGLNQPATVTAFAAEIYKPNDYATLTGATNTGSSQANVIFSTSEFVGKTWNIGSTVGYTCPIGYSLDGCGTAFTCTQIFKTGMTANCSGVCTDNCTTIVDGIFPFIDSGSTGVYIFDSTTASTVSLNFNFTANTGIFTSTNASFKYEIYKYNPKLRVFTVPPVYKSDVIQYSTFSATNVLNQSIPLSGLSLDGDYIVKGYYEADACTDFLKRLGKKIDTVVYKNGSNYQLYDSNLDFYFVGIEKAEKPLFTPSQIPELSFYDALPLYQQVIYVNDANDFIVTEGQGDNEIQVTGNTYDRSGNTFTLNSEYVGDVFVTLNGRGLAKNVEYSFSGNVLTIFTGVTSAITTGDMISLIYTRTSTLTIVPNPIKISTPIPSGATGTQGSSKYFYNTTTGKYEIYLDNEPINNSKIVLVLNGVFLESSIDFYQSTSDKKRLILIGSLMMGDLILVVYYPTANIINGITQNSNYIAWYVPKAPQSNNGQFFLEYSLNSGFSSYTVSNIVDYLPQVTNYGSILFLTGSVGTNLYYRVKNSKNYRSICGDIVESVAYSDVVPVQIQTNAINSY